MNGSIFFLQFFFFNFFSSTYSNSCGAQEQYKAIEYRPSQSMLIEPQGKGIEYVYRIARLYVPRKSLDISDLCC